MTGGRTRRISSGAAALLGVALLGAGEAPVGKLRRWTEPDKGMERDGGPMPMKSQIPSLAGATGWLNSPPLTADQLQGKVVLFDFWTYTCINWRRTFPYVKAWAQRYAGEGLVVVGVHTPEFPFEHDLENVREQARAIGVDYPIALDNEFEVWRAFRNDAWPAVYLFDSQGRLRHRHLGEGDYEETEKVLRRLLAEAARREIGPTPARVTVGPVELAADWSRVGSGETYLGVRRSEGFASPGGLRAGEARAYSAPEVLPLNSWALSGTWTVDDEGVRLEQTGGRIAYRFRARDVNLIMGPPRRGAAVRFRVLLDGKPPGPAHGLDVDEAGNGTAREQRMYQLIRQQGSPADRRFEIEFLDAGAEAFDFTFG